MMVRRTSRLTIYGLGRSLPVLVVIVLAAANILALFSTFSAHPWEATTDFSQIINHDGLIWGRAGILVTTLLLLLLARALARGKRQAWLLSVGLVVFSFLAALTARASVLPLLLLLGLLFVLLAVAPLFSARSDLHALRRGYTALLLGLVALIGHGTIHVLIHIGSASILLLEPRGLLFVLRAAAYLLLSYGVIEVLRPVLRVRDASDIEHDRAVAVVERAARMSLAHYTLAPNFSYYWSASGRSFIAYRTSVGIAVALGDPIGAEEEFAGLIRGFLEFCHRQGWQLAVYQASPHALNLFAHDNIHAVKVGEEAVVDITTFTLEGKIGAPVRHSIARAKRGGVTIACWRGEAPPEKVFVGMKRISAAWLRAHHTHSQMGFSMGRFPADWSPDLLTCVALGPDDEVQAFVTWTPLYASNGWTLDNMRRANGTVPGAMEYLIAASIDWARAQNYRFMSLSLAPLVGLREDELQTIRAATQPIGMHISRLARLLERCAASLHTRGLLLGNYRSLYFFKQKFQPIWEARYLVIEDISTLPRVLLALAIVHGMSGRTLLDDIAAALRKPSQATMPEVSARASVTGEHTSSTSETNPTARLRSL